MAPKRGKKRGLDGVGAKSLSAEKGKKPSFDRSKSYTLRLKCDGDVPKFPFYDYPFTMKVFLVDPDNIMLCKTNVALDLALVFDSSVRASNELEEVEPNSGETLLSIADGGAKIDKTGYATITIKIKTLSMQHLNKKFRVRVRPKEPSLKLENGETVPITPRDIAHVCGAR